MSTLGTAKPCGAKKKSGGLCQQPAMENGRCRLHGGKALKGAAHPNYQGGRYSKYMPRHIADDFERSREDARLLELTDDIALVDARAGELLQRLSDGGSVESWEEIGTLLPQLRVYVEKGETQNGLDAIDHLYELWLSSREEHETWQEIYVVLNQRRQLVESEKKRLVDMNLMIAADRAFLIINALQDIILRNVADVRARSAIADEIRRLASTESS